MRLLPSISFLAAIAALAVACGGGEKSKTTETVEKTVEQQAEAPRDQGEGIPWDQKSHEQQKAYMGMTVKPQMEKLFNDFDPERFKEVKCSTCHGQNARDRNFEMPNPDLPKLDDWQKLKAEQPEMMEFMMQKVAPQMATLLGQPPFDPETKTGFGCGGCHPQ